MRSADAVTTGNAVRADPAPDGRPGPPGFAAVVIDGTVMAVLSGDLDAGTRRVLAHHLAQIARILRAQQESFAYGAIYQFYDAVMAQFESLRSVCNCYWRVLFRACNLKQKLMLLRLQTGCNRSFFAEMQKLSQLKAKLCETFQERTVIGRGWFDSHL